MKNYYFAQISHINFQVTSKSQNSSYNYRTWIGKLAITIWAILLTFAADLESASEQAMPGIVHNMINP